MEFDFKASFKGRRCLALCVCATFLIGCIFWFDLIGYDSWMPKTNQVESAAVSFDSLSGTNKAYLQAQEEAGVSEEDMEWGVSEYLLNHMKLTGDEVETLLQLVEQGIDGSTQENTQDEACYSFTVRYQMKDGRTIERSYYAIGGEKVKQAVCDLCNTSSYKGTVYPILGTDDTDYQVYEYHNSTEQWEATDVDDTMQETILATYRKELSAFDTKLCFEEAPIGKIAFVKKGMSDAYIASYPIYTSFTETRTLLDSLGISYQVNIAQISQIDVEYYNEKDGLESTKSYTDKEQIEEIMKNVICDDNSDFTGISVITRNYNYDVTLYYNNTKHETNSAYFIQGKIPDFVLKDFGN
jgi:ABC-2 type transport system permease protein